jgi:MFS family permease
VSTGQTAARNSRSVLGNLPRAHPVSWWMLGITTLAILITSIDRVILPTVLPGVLQDFHLSATEGGELVSLSFLGTFVGALGLGMLGDLVGRGHRRGWTWIATVAVTCVSSIVTAYTSTLAALRAWRVAMGIGTGSMEPINVAMVAEWWPKEHRGFATGVHHTGFPFGQLLGPVLIGAILTAGGWRDAFLWIPLIAVPIMLLQVVVGRRANLDRVNRWITDHGMTPTVRTEESREFVNPLRAMRTVIGERNVWCGLGMSFGLLWAEAGVTAFLTTQLVEQAHMSMAAAAVTSGASGVTGWLGQVVLGTLSDRTGRKSTLGVICVGWAVTVAAMPLIHSAAMAWGLLILWGLFRNAPFPVAYALIIDSTPKAASSGMGLTIGIAFGLSGVFGPTVSGWMIDQVGFTANYLLMAGICLLMVLPVLLIRETVRRRGAAERTQQEVAAG